MNDEVKNNIQTFIIAAVLAALVLGHNGKFKKENTEKTTTKIENVHDSIIHKSDTTFQKIR